MSLARVKTPIDGVAPGWHRLDGRAVLASIAIALLAAAMGYSLATHALLDDGAQMAEEFGTPGGLPLWFHVLHFPAAAALCSFGAAPDRALLLVSVLAAGVLLGCVNGAAWVVTGRRGAAMAATLAVALCPGVVRHATFIEVHALHAACVGLVTLALVSAHARPRLVLAVACAGAALTVLTHRSGVLVAPALAMVATAALRQREPARAARRAALATAVGTLLGYGADELVHRWIGGPTLLGSLAHIGSAATTPSLAHALHEVGTPLGALWFGALWFGSGGATALRFAPLVALACHGIPIVLAAIPTNGGYVLGAAPLLALGVARLLAARRGRWLPFAFAGAVALAAWCAAAAIHDPMRTGLSELRERRIALVDACLPDGGTVFSLSPGRQHVTGTRRGVREIDGFQCWAVLALDGEPPAAIRARLRELLDAALAQGPVLWTAEWRDAPLPPAVRPLLEDLQAGLVQGLRQQDVPGTRGRACWLRH